jgi:fructose transport system substrate-binding protein
MDRANRRKLRVSLITGALVLALSGSSQAMAADIVGLITKSNSSPFFIKMKEGAEAKAKDLGVELRSFAGKDFNDNDSQVAAIETLIAAGAKGFAVVANDTRAIAPAVKKARDAGLMVVALDSPLDPPALADATFATDNFKAGEIIGQWAAKTLGPSAKNAKIAMLDLTVSPVTVDYLRDHGFLKGFGIPYKDLTKNGSEGADPRIIGHAVTGGEDAGGRTAMENLLQKDSSVNVVYTMDEEVASGAYKALEAAGKEKGVLIVSIDGGCTGVKNIKDGTLGATAQQYPLLMAAKGVEAIETFAKTGKKPEVTPGLNFTDTGVALVTDKPVEGIPSISSDEGLKKCWG